MDFRSSDYYRHHSSDGYRYYSPEDPRYRRIDDPLYRESDDYVPIDRTALDAPICHAISNQNQLEITVEGIEDVNANERKIVTKMIIVDPYAFGVTVDGRPVLHGTVVKETLVNEVTIRSGDARFHEIAAPSNMEEGDFSGWFSGKKNVNIDIQKIVNIHVIENSHFDAPKNFKGMEDDNVRVICQLPVAR